MSYPGHPVYILNSWPNMDITGVSDTGAREALAAQDLRSCWGDSAEKTLSRRDHFAMAAMAAIIGKVKVLEMPVELENPAARSVAAGAVEYADALITELDKP